MIADGIQFDRYEIWWDTLTSKYVWSKLWHLVILPNPVKYIFKPRLCLYDVNFQNGSTPFNL